MGSILPIVPGYAQTIQGEIELNGFLLGQYRTAVHHQLGKPIQRIDTDDGWIYEFNLIKPDTSVYALFKYPQWDTLHVFAIQINGHALPEMHPFKGLKLGADRTAVIKALGPSQETDTLDNPRVIIQSYRNKNYSVEIDEAGKLYGIQIYGSILNNKPTEVVPSLDGFMKAIVSKNTDSLLLHLMPDVEAYVADRVITFTGSARSEFTNRKSELVERLVGRKESIWYALTQEKAHGEPELRVYSERKISTTVYKFYDSKILQEIVFMPHADRWKVYEIRFR